MLKTNFPMGADLPARVRAPKRKRGKVGRSYIKLGTSTTTDARGVRSPGFFPLPLTWGNGPIARDIRAHGGERIAGRVEYPLPWSPKVGTVVKGCPTVTVGASNASVALDPCSDPITRFVVDGDNTARDARRKVVVRAMVKASK